MTQLAPITLDDGTTIYIEAVDRNDVPTAPSTSGESGRVSKGSASSAIQQQLPTVKNTITQYTRYVLNAFQELGSGNVDKVNLEFGLKIAGSAGIPYITEGSAEANLQITVECSFKE
ncbi:MAG: CU044_2847 family protein [Cyanobacteria bacterium P01_D01_bin.156]